MIHIDLDNILRTRMGKEKSKFLPRFATRMLEKFIHQDELNEVLQATDPSTGSEFSEKVYDFFDLTLTVRGMENIPTEGRFIFTSNHPLGGLDGIGIIKVLGKRYGDSGIRFLVNDMLMNVEPLRTVFLPINKYGAQGRTAARHIADAYASDAQIIIFPAGLVSRLQPDGDIKDLKWQKSFVAKAIEFRRDIIPMRFHGLNRKRFYSTAYWRKRLGIGVNIEQAMLPAELCAARGKHFELEIGKPISYKKLQEARDAGKSLQEIADSIRECTYHL